MMNIYARTMMIATLADASEPAGADLSRRPGWIARARRWVAAHRH
jgi:hypothetical protein